MSSINAYSNYLKKDISQKKSIIFKENSYGMFVSHIVPKISIHNYIKLLFYNGLVGLENIDSIILYSIILLNNIKTKGLPFNKYTCHRLTLISLMLASKINEDMPYNNNYWASIGGITLKNINNMESMFIKLLNHDLSIIITPQKAISIYRCIY